MTMLIGTNEFLTELGSIIATLMFIKAIYDQYIPQQWRDFLLMLIMRYSEWAVRFLSPNLTITFDEYSRERFGSRCETYKSIERYLSENCSKKAKGLKASSMNEDGKGVVLDLSDYEQVTDEFEGVEVCWSCRLYTSNSENPAYDKRYYRLTFQNRHRKLITESYLKHIIEEGKAIEIKRRQRKIFTNINDSYESWSPIEFKHPASFDTLALDPIKKQAIITDLLLFKAAKNYYAKIGKPWKRGYLLYGRPGTGKSTMISAMANFLEYDIYDLELTSVKDNTQLRRLLIATSGKSIIVIEDIDCSLDLTGQRSNVNDKDEDEDNDENNKGDKLKKSNKETNRKSEVTLSGLLNFIDGIWSACGQERIIIFTTNYIDKLDPALIRRGRMDMHIELSYCCFEAFKMLARNYLDVETHPLFNTIRRLLEETEMTPADVAEILMPKTLELDANTANVCLKSMVSALEKSKEETRLKAEEENQKEKAKVKGKENEENKVKESKEKRGDEKKL